MSGKSRLPSKMMIPENTLARRQFMKISTLAASATLLPSVGMAAPGEVFVLEKLPYPFAALEPFIDAKTMEIHHDKHHASYLKNLNAVAPKVGLDELLATLPSVTDEALRTTLRNNGGGHWNHDFFWKALAPAADSGKPSVALVAAIDAAFGSMDGFKKTFSEAATKRFGSGWAWLIVQDGKLKVTSTANQDNPKMKGVIPDSDLGTALLGLDVWEHAYYLNYQNRRPDYITAFWKIVNWNAVSERFAKA
jgi:superoxide dismutase, Fe-Mn family